MRFWTRYKNSLLIVVGIKISSFFAFSVARQSEPCIVKKLDLFQKTAREISYFLKDGVWIYRNLFSIDSAKIITAATPMYLCTRFADEKFQHCFYDQAFHKNINQLPFSVVKGVEKAISATVFSAAALSIFSPDKRLRITSRVFAVGLLSGLFMKDMIKGAKTQANIRPWHECFSPKKRSYGGLPSGHMFEIVYMTTLFGLEYGLKAWIPLGIFSGCMAVVSISANRHYFSQVVAGSALGIMYGVASYKRVHDLIDESFGIGFVANARLVGVSCRYMF